MELEYKKTFAPTEAFVKEYTSGHYKKPNYCFDSDLKYKIIQLITPDEVFKLFEQKTKERFERERLELVKDSSLYNSGTQRYPVKFSTAELYALAKAKSVKLQFEPMYEQNRTTSNN